MKKKDLGSLRAKTAEELIKMVSERRVDLTKIKANVKASKEKNLKKIKNLRHELSQILTLLKEKEILEKETKSEGKEDVK